MQSRSEHAEQSPPQGRDLDDRQLLPVHADRKHLLPVADVSARTGLSRWTIYRRIRSGEWPSVRSGRKHLIPRPFVEGLLAASEGSCQVIAKGAA
ncbi:excisionase family DNA-binding protein [Actinomadura sp. NPDC049382]|uniref:excisionase family DNA-binding protein n=1 Tax=Actinomadura sp. NPDC049382 TaxID=3158220 RepID=UPI003427F179